VPGTSNGAAAASQLAGTFAVVVAAPSEALNDSGTLT